MWFSEIVNNWLNKMKYSLSSVYMLVSFLKNSVKIKFAKYTLDWYIKEIIIMFFFFFSNMCECLVGHLKVMRDTGPPRSVWACPAHCRTSSVPGALQKMLVTFCISETAPHNSKKSPQGTTSTPWELVFKRLSEGSSFSFTFSTL